jgi:hypothetical protein
MPTASNFSPDPVHLDKVRPLMSAEVTPPYHLQTTPYNASLINGHLHRWDSATTKCPLPWQATARLARGSESKRGASPQPGRGGGGGGGAQTPPAPPPEGG